MIPITILAIIILVRLFFLFDLHTKFKIFKSNDREIQHSMNMLINDCLDYLDANDFEKSVLIYKEIRLSYEKISENLKKENYEPIIHLANMLDEKYVNKIIEKKEKEKLRKIIPCMSADIRNKFLSIIQLMDK